MVRIAILAIAFALAATASARAQAFPPQPAPPASPLGEGNPQERAACHPDVIRYCQTQVDANPNDVLGILGCLQANRTRISPACQDVLASHGQ